MLCNLFDSHVHSDNSFDAKNSITHICEQAVARGISGISITDHADVGFTDEATLHKIVRQSSAETLLAKFTFKKSLVVLSGVELGNPTLDTAVAEKLIGSYNLDVVLAALHMLKDEEDFFFIDFTQVDVDALMKKYYETLLEIVHWNKFDSLAHLDYPLRYIEGKYEIPFNREKYKGIVKEILSTLAKNQKALEINTSQLRKPYNQITPTLEQLEFFRKEGGKHITLGSDSHSAHDVGSNLGDGMELAQAAGYNHFTVYYKRTPRMLKII